MNLHEFTFVGVRKKSNIAMDLPKTIRAARLTHARTKSAVVALRKQVLEHLGTARSSENHVQTRIPLQRAGQDTCVEPLVAATLWRIYLKRGKIT